MIARRVATTLRRGVGLALLGALLLGYGGADLATARATPTAATPVPIGVGPGDADALAAIDGWPAPDIDQVHAYLLVEGETGQILAAQRADERRPVASTVKILTALSVARRADFDEVVTVGPEVANVPGSSAGLVPGDQWRVEELLDALISRSGNDAAEALAVHVGGSAEGLLDMMREDAADLGLDDPVLVSVSGLDDANLLTAHDLSILGRAVLADEQLGPLFGREQVTLPGAGTLATRNLLLGRYEGATGVKTGFTQAAGNSLVASAERDGRTVLAVVLDAGEDPARFDAAATLLDLGFDAFAVDTLSSTLSYRLAAGAVHVNGGPVKVSSPQDNRASLAIPLTARAPEVAPDAQVLVGGTRLGLAPTTLELQDAPDEVTGGAVIGRAAADGIYAALRAMTDSGTLR